MFKLVSASQAAICDIAAGQPARAACSRLLDVVPEPRGRLEELLLLGSLTEIALQGFRGSAEERRRRLDAAVAALVRARERHRLPRYVIAEWVAARIQKNLATPLNVRALAAEAHCHETTLRRAFREAFGVSMREFRMRVCTRGALTMLGDDTGNVLAIARLLGYKDDRSLYRVVRKVVGVTPARLKEVPPEVRHQIVELPRGRRS
jgi:AraC-like DNA-binding protein